jgi:hypothetical protein
MKNSDKNKPGRLMTLSRVLITLPNQHLKIYKANAR